MVVAWDQAPPLRTAYRRANPPPCDGSIQLNTAAPSGATDQLGCRLPGPAGFASGVTEKVWPKAGSANMAPKSIDWIFTWVAPVLVYGYWLISRPLRWLACRSFQWSPKPDRPACSDRYSVPRRLAPIS